MILIAGGTGTLRRQVVRLLTARGLEVRQKTLRHYAASGLGWRSYVLVEAEEVGGVVLPFKG